MLLRLICNVQVFRNVPTVFQLRGVPRHWNSNDSDYPDELQEHTSAGCIYPQLVRMPAYWSLEHAESAVVGEIRLWHQPEYVLCSATLPFAVLHKATIHHRNRPRLQHGSECAYVQSASGAIAQLFCGNLTLSGFLSLG